MGINCDFMLLSFEEKKSFWELKYKYTSVISSILLFKSYIYYKYFIQFRNPTNILKNGKYFNKQPAAR